MVTRNKLRKNTNNGQQPSGQNNRGHAYSPDVQSLSGSGDIGGSRLSGLSQSPVNNLPAATHVNRHPSPSRLSALSQSSGLSQRTVNSQAPLRPHKPVGNEPVRLKKRVGIVSGTALIVGTMIGSGIFISPTGVTENVGSVGATLIIWIVCGLISLLVARYEDLYLSEGLGSLRPGWLSQTNKLLAHVGALCYAELGTMIPKSGGEYSYLLECAGAFGGLHKLVGPIPAYLFSWTNIILLRPAAQAILALAFATYVLQPFFTLCNLPDGGQKCLAALCILVIVVINCASVRLATWLQNILTIAKLLAIIIIVLVGFAQLGKVLLTAVNSLSVRGATRVQVVFTATKLLALLAIIIGGFVSLLQGNTQYLSQGFSGTKLNAGKIAVSMYHGMWAYDGWNNLNYVTEELINPYTNLPRAIMIGIPLVMICYLLVIISYFTVMNTGVMIAAPAVAVTWGNNTLGIMSWLIPLFVACSTLGAANGTMFSTGRLTYVAAREGHMVEILSMVHVRQFTPLPSLIFTSILALIFIIPGDISSLINFFNFAVWLFYGASMAALLYMRYDRPNEPRPYKVPIVLPIIVLIVSVFLVIAPLFDEPRIEILFAFLFIVFGLVFYFPFVYFQKSPKFMDKVTKFLQYLLEVSVAEVEESTDA